MAIALIGLGLALTAFALQWYVGKKADEEKLLYQKKKLKKKKRRHK